MRPLTSLARHAPVQLVEALGLELSPRRARLLGVVPQALIFGDGTRKVRVTTTCGAMPAKTPGVVVAAVPPGAALTLARHLSWGGLSAAVQGQWWPPDSRPYAEDMAITAALVQADVDNASVAKPETLVAELVAGPSLLPAESRAAIAVAAQLGPTWGVVEGPSWRPVVFKTRPAGGPFSHRVEFTWAGSGQLCLLVENASVHGPTWRRRRHDPERYAEAGRRMVEACDAEMRPGGWLRRAGTVLAGQGWEIVPGEPDHLLAAAGVGTHFYLRPPNCAGLLWRGFAAADLAGIVGSLRTCAVI